MNDRADQIVEEFKTNLDKFVDGEVLAKGAITGILEKACGGKEKRYQVLKVFTGKTSSKELTEAEWYGLLMFVQPYKPEGGKWQSQRGPELESMCKALLENQEQ